MFEPYIFVALGAAVASTGTLLLTKHILKNVSKDVFVFLIYSTYEKDKIEYTPASIVEHINTAGECPHTA